MARNGKMAEEMTTPASPTATSPTVGTVGSLGSLPGICQPYWIESVIEATRLELPGLQTLAVDVQQQMLTERLDTLQQRGLLSADVAAMFKRKVTGSSDFGTEPDISLFDAAGGLSLAGVLNKVLTPPGSAEFVSLGGAITTALAAAGGGLVGAVLGGPPGAVIGVVAGAFIASESVT
jgi:hypothetical protein